MNLQRTILALYVLGSLAYLDNSNYLIEASEEEKEYCYRGSASLDYNNPCFGEPGQPEKYDFCPKGQRLAQRCTQNCTYCEPGFYQNTFTNCSTCLPCKTKTDCEPGQVIQECTVDSDTVCGCPARPTCPTCPSRPVLTPCPSLTPCPVQTECPACEYPTNAQDGYMASCSHFWIPLIVVTVLLLASVIAAIGYCIFRLKGHFQHRDNKRPSKSVAPLAKEEDNIEDIGQSGKSSHSGGEDEKDSGSAEASEGTDESDELLSSKLEDMSKQSLQDSPHPAFVAGNSSEPSQTIEADETSEEPSVYMQPLNSMNGEHEAKPKGFCQLFDRQQSVPLADSMRLTFQYLSKKLSREWQAVGRRLQLRDATLEQIRLDHSNSIREAVYNMLLTWQQQRGHAATYPVLMKALEEEDRQDLVDHLKDWEDVAYYY